MPLTQSQDYLHLTVSSLFTLDADVKEALENYPEVRIVNAQVLQLMGTIHVYLVLESV